MGKASISCISLSSTLSHGQCWESPSSSQFYGTPSPKATDEDTGPVRIVEKELSTLNGSPQTSIPLPAEMRPGSRNSLLLSTTEVAEDVGIGSDGNIVTEALHQRCGIDYWCHLPTEIQLRILSCLTPKELGRAASVSKSWYRLCFDGQLWTNFDVSTYYRDIPREALMRLIFDTGSFIQHLNLRGCIQLQDAWIENGEEIADACRNLASVNLVDTNIDKLTVTFFLVRNSRLVKIDLSGLPTVTNSEINVIAKSCPLLECLDVSWCRNLVNANGLRRVVKACNRLKELRMGEFQAADNLEFMQQLFETNTLETLVMPQCVSLSDTSFKVLLHGAHPEVDILSGRPIVPPRKLKHLDLSRCGSLTDAGIDYLVGCVPDLESLQLSFCRTLGSDSITSLIRTTPRLARLELEELDEVNNAVLIALSKAACASTMEHLNVSYCERLGDPGMMQVVKNCPNLKTLELDNTKVSDLTLMELCNQMRKRGYGTALPKFGLRLAVFDCGNVTWAGVREILSNNSFVPRYIEPEAINMTAKAEDESDITASSPSLSPSSSASSVTVQPTTSALPVTAAVAAAKVTQCQPNLYPNEIIQLKCFYGWQRTVDRHTKRVLNGKLGAALRLECKWADCMIFNEEAEAGGIGARRRRRRRARNADMSLFRGTGDNDNGNEDYDEDEDDQDVEYGYGPAGLASLGNRRRRARSGGCVVM